MAAGETSQSAGAHILGEKGTDAQIVAFLAAERFDLYGNAPVADRRRDDPPRQGNLVFVRRTSALAVDHA